MSLHSTLFRLGATGALAAILASAPVILVPDRLTIESSSAQADKGGGAGGGAGGDTGTDTGDTGGDTG
jgi:hypothetical protein